jgi:hypothetical protein
LPESVRLKLAYDLYYIEHATLWLDVRLMLSTALKMLHVPFGVSRMMFRIPAGPKVPISAARPNQRQSMHCDRVSV